MSETSNLLSLRDVSSRTCLSRGAIHQLVRSGRLSAVRFGRRVLVREADLVEFIDSLSPVATGPDDAA